MFTPPLQEFRRFYTLTTVKTPNAAQKFPSRLTLHASRPGCIFVPNMINSIVY